MNNKTVISTKSISRELLEKAYREMEENKKKESDKKGA